MFHKLLLAMACVWFLSNAVSVNAQDRPLETLKTSVFLKLPSDLQAIYIGGVLDGMSYVSYGTQDPKLRAWTNCVRTKSLGESTEEVVRWLTEHEEERWWPVPWAVAKVIGMRKCPR